MSRKPTARTNAERSAQNDRTVVRLSSATALSQQKNGGAIVRVTGCRVAAG
jgi:hypothetical protein